MLLTIWGWTEYIPALCWFDSYLYVCLPWSGKVYCLSPGVAEGVVLGPFLFSLDRAPPPWTQHQLIRMSCYCYADGIQFISPSCKTTTVSEWTSAYFTYLSARMKNTFSWPLKRSHHSIPAGLLILPTKSAKNLVVISDDLLNFTRHI